MLCTRRCALACTGKRRLRLLPCPSLSSLRCPRRRSSPAGAPARAAQAHLFLPGAAHPEARRRRGVRQRQGDARGGWVGGWVEWVGWTAVGSAGGSCQCGRVRCGRAVVVLALPCPPTPHTPHPTTHPTHPHPTYPPTTTPAPTPRLLSPPFCCAAGSGLLFCQPLARS